MNPKISGPGGKHEKMMSGPGQKSRVQEQPPAPAVLGVPDNGVPLVRQMDPDLMGPPGAQHDQQEGPASGRKVL